MATPTSPLSMSATFQWTTGVGTYAQPVPAAPVNLTAVAVSASQINAALPQPNSAATQTEWSYKLTSSGIWLVAATTPANTTSLPFVGLIAAASYDFRARYNGLNGFSTYSNTATVSTGATPSVPVLSLTVNSSTQITVSMSVFPANATSVAVQRSLDGVNFSALTTVNTPNLSYVDTGVSANTLYYYSAASTGPGGTSAFSTPVSATTTSGGSPTLLTGTGFGTNANFAAARFMDFTGFTEGAGWITAGGDSIDLGANTFTHGTATAKVTNTDGLPSGGGCWEKHITADTSNTGNATDGPFYRENILVSGTDELTVFKHVKIFQVSGIPPSNLGAQYKGTRITTTNNADIYLATPKLTASCWTSNATTGVIDCHYFVEGGAETNVPGATGLPLNIYDGNWHSTFMQGKMNSVGNANALDREWWDGTYEVNVNNLNLRTTPGLQFVNVMINPGEANGYGSSGQWYVRHARVVAFRGLGWCAFGNAATFAACTGLYVVDPTAWSNTAISFNSHGARPSGYNWMYVMDATGTLVNSSGLTSFL